MTVKLLGPWGLQPAGTLYTTDATTEAAMVAAKVATNDLTVGVVYVPPGGATVAAPKVGGGGGGGGGDDVQDWGGFTGGLSGSEPTTVKFNGVTWTIAYVAGTNNPESYTVALSGADDLVTTINYDNGYSEAAGSIIKGGAVTMTAVQARYLASEVLASAGALANGFKARVTDLFYSTTTGAATPVYHEGVLEWATNRWRPVNGCAFDVWHNATHSNSLAESAALSTVVLPRWLCGAGNIWRNKIIHTATGGTSTVLQTRVKVNGTARLDVTSASGASPTNALELDIFCAEAAAQFYLPNSASALGGTISSSSVYQTTSIDSAATDITVTTTGQVTVAEAARVITHRLTRVELLA